MRHPLDLQDMNNNKCCEKCVGWELIEDVPRACDDKNCPCHLSTPERLLRMEAENHERTSSQIAQLKQEVATPSPTEDWESWESWARTLANSTNPKDIDLLIAKIKVLLLSHTESMVEAIEGMKVVETITFEDGDTAINPIHQLKNSILSDVIAIIRNNIK